MGIRRKISLMTLLITIISIFITAAIGFFFNYKLGKENIYMAMDKEVTLLSSEVNNWLDQKAQVIEVLCDVIEKNQLTKDQIKELITNINQDKEVSDIYMGFADGDFLSSVEWQPPENYDPTMRPWYNSLMNREQVAFSEPYLDMTTGEEAVSIGRRVIDKNGHTIGVLAADILVDTLFDKLSNVNFQGIGYAYLIDAKENLLAHPDPQLRHQNLSEIPDLAGLSNTLITQKNGMTEYVFKDVEKVTVFRAVQRSGWIIGVTVPQAIIHAPLRILLAQFTIVFFVIAILSVIISYALSRNIVERVNRLLVKTKQIAQGQFDEVVEAEGDDEIAALSTSFNQMGDNIRKYIFELDAYNQVLEQKVALAAQEITDRKMQLLEAEKLNSLSYLVSGVAHEMNTPIGNCIMLSTYMQRTLTETAENANASKLNKAEFMKAIEDLGQCCEKLIYNLETGKHLIADFKELAVENISYTPGEVDIEGVIHRSFQQASGKAVTNLSLELKVEPGLILISDSIRLYKLFCELMDNITHHGYEGRSAGLVKISVASSPDDNGYRIIVDDDGAGFEETTLDKAFLPFFSTKFSGTHSGLGLSVVYNIVKSLNGNIKLSHNEMGGARIDMIIEQQRP